MKDIDHVKLVWERETEFINQSRDSFIVNDSIKREHRTSRLLRLSMNSLLGFFEYFSLLTVLIFRIISGKSRTNLLFLTNSFCLNTNGNNELRIGKNIIPKSTIFINASKDLYLNRVGSKKVYNIGLLIKVVSVFWFREGDLIIRNYKAYKAVNSLLLFFRSSIDKIYFYCHYDLNAFSLVFSKYRSECKLVEIQHGSMINYPIYSIPSPVKVADIFYVKNLATIDYLKSHINRNFVCEYRLLNYPEKTRVNKPGLSILYASSLELGGFHPVFKEFIKSTIPANFGGINLSIRLHPREKGKEHLFIEELKRSNVNYWFDDSDNWLNSNAIKELIVVSPWSSIIEEAVDNNYKAIIIDVTGHERYEQLVDDVGCFYSKNLSLTINDIRKDFAQR